MIQSQNPASFQDFSYGKNSSSQSNLVWNDYDDEQNGQDASNIFENSDEDFNEWLVTVNLEFDFDYTLTESTKESKDFLLMSMASCVNSKYKKHIGPYDVRMNGHSDKSKLAGKKKNNTFLLKFCRMKSVKIIFECF